MSESEFEQDPGGYVEEQGGDESYEPGWDEQQEMLDPYADPAVFDQAVRAIIDERLAPSLEFVAGLQQEAALTARVARSS
jgi:hypothetical protein